MKTTTYKTEEWQATHFSNFLRERGKDSQTELDLDLALLNQMQDEFPDEWADFAVLEGV